MFELSLSNDSALPLQWIVVICASLAAAASDIVSRRIPNALTLPLLGAALVWNALQGGLPGFGASVAGAAIAGFPFLILFAFAGGGAGDAKMMCAVGAWLGIAHGVVALASVCAAGIVLAVGFAAAKSRLRAATSNVSSIARAFLVVVGTRGRVREVGAMIPAFEEMQAIPYGVSILLGVLMATAGVSLCSL